MFKRLFRVYAHIYHSHFREMVALGAEAHLNSSFKRFSAFVLEFRLVDSRELAPMRDLILKMLGPAALSRGAQRPTHPGC